MDIWMFREKRVINYIILIDWEWYWRQEDMIKYLEVGSAIDSHGKVW